MSSSNTNDDENEPTTVSNFSSNNGRGKYDGNIREGIATEESKAVMRLRLLVLTVVVLAAGFVCSLVYTLSSKGMYDEYQTKFEGHSEQIEATFQKIASEKLGSLGALRVSAMSEAIDKNNTWPFYTMSSFEKRAAVSRRLSETLLIGIYPWVTNYTRSEYETYAAKFGPHSINESVTYQSKVGIQVFGGSSELPFNESATKWPITTSVLLDPSDNIPDPGNGPFLPMWQQSPLVPSLVNFNFLRIGIASVSNEPMMAYDTGHAVMSAVLPLRPGSIKSVPASATNYYASLLSIKAGKEVYYEGDPISQLYLPVYESFNDGRNNTVAIVTAVVQWTEYFRKVLPANEKEILIVLDDSCTGPSTFIIKGKDVAFVGKGDLHDQSFNGTERNSSWESIETVEDGTEYGLPYLASHCPPSIQIYPTSVYKEDSYDKSPVYITVVVSLVFIFAILVFITYDRLVERRQKLVLTKALQSTAIVSSLFPRNIAERLMKQQKTDDNNKKKLDNNQRLRSFVLHGENNLDQDDMNEAPIADLFPNATVFFADIAGFTAWSSSREPTKVFVLLQNVYKAFDLIANRRKVFKVETIGDSYVAVTGCPENQEQHAVIMARFATECMRKMAEVTSSLCVTLGPDTNELSMRIGIHSGPVTAGVLQGDRARFQLFGDTVNTASRMESTGIKNKIQVSQSTAQFLTSAGKGHWLSPREDHVNAKGKGFLVTYWLNIHSNSKASTLSASQTGSLFDQDSKVFDAPKQNENHALLVDWVCELLQPHIKKLSAIRKTEIDVISQKAVFEANYLKIPLDEVVEAITLPEYNEVPNTANFDETMEDLPPIVTEQLRQYISLIASTYRNNHFHNIQHACHVAMSSNKLLMRVANPIFDRMESSNTTQEDLDHHIHDYTYGINSDPITILAIILSAIIHDVDHRGVSNTQLIKEELDLANKYRRKSVAEQNSLDIAWSLLVSDQFEALRNCIFITQQEADRFRQVLINSVLATDIFDKELNDLRKERWEKAFSTTIYSTDQSEQSKRNLRATIVIEHIIQASDVAHTMQHWHVYRKWNKLLFLEMYQAYKSGRMRKNPCDFWFEGELLFFDNYVIPLARKLKECNVFGVSSDEYLNYAEKNRAEWETRGSELVLEMIDEFCSVDHTELSERSVLSI